MMEPKFDMDVHMGMEPKIREPPQKIPSEMVPIWVIHQWIVLSNWSTSLLDHPRLQLSETSMESTRCWAFDRLFRGGVTRLWYWGSYKELGVIYFPTNWGAKEPQNPPNHRVGKPIVFDSFDIGLLWLHLSKWNGSAWTGINTTF